MKHVPIRSCCGCRVRRPKKELIRFYAGPDGRLTGDPNGSAPGRGAYLCLSPECLKLALKKSAFNRTLRAKGLQIDGDRLLSVIAGIGNNSKGLSGEVVHGENLGR